MLIKGGCAVTMDGRLSELSQSDVLSTSFGETRADRRLWKDMS
jgi:hypothetical protein